MKVFKLDMFRLVGVILIVLCMTQWIPVSAETKIVMPPSGVDFITRYSIQYQKSFQIFAYDNEAPYVLPFVYVHAAAIDLMPFGSWPPPNIIVDYYPTLQYIDIQSFPNGQTVLAPSLLFNVSMFAWPYPNPFPQPWSTIQPHSEFIVNVGASGVHGTAHEQYFNTLIQID